MALPKMIVLCVDDDGSGLAARKELLEASGYEVITAQNGREGLELFDSHHIDAVILDYQMHKMNGAQVASQMRRVKPDVPILMLSGWAKLPPEELSCVDEFLCKGQPWSTVLSSLDRLLSSRPTFFVRWLHEWQERAEND